MILYNVRFGSSRCAQQIHNMYEFFIECCCSYIACSKLSFSLCINIFAVSIMLQQMMMKQQDEGLEMLGQSAERLSKISMGIHEELGHQNK